MKTKKHHPYGIDPALAPEQIGQPVWIDYICRVEYDGENNRVVWRRQVATTGGVVCGVKTLQLGKYRAGTRFGYSCGDEEPAHLSVTGQIRLYEVRTGLVNKPVLVSPKDLNLRKSLRLSEIYAHLRMIGPAIEPITEWEVVPNEDN